MELTIKKGAESPFKIKCGASDTVDNLKSKIEAAKGFAPPTMRLIFAGKELKSPDLLSSYDLKTGDLILLMVRPTEPGKPASSVPIEAPVVAAPVVQPSQPKKEPAFPPEVENCWKAAYIADWGAAVKFLDSVVSLDTFEERCKMPVIKFFAERGMVDAIKYVVERRGNPSFEVLLDACNASVAANKVQSLEYLLTLVSSLSELEKLKGEVQPLHVASVCRWPKIVQLLLKHGANVNLKASNPSKYIKIENGNQITPAMAFFVSRPEGPKNWVEEDIPKTLELLLSDPKADLNLQDELGNTVLHLAVQQYDKVGVGVILGFDEIDISIKNNEGKTARECCQPGIFDEKGKVPACERVFRLHDKGQVPRKRKRSDGSTGDVSEEPQAKRIRVSPGIGFYTLNEDVSRVKEWTRSLGLDEEDDDTGKLREDEGKTPLIEAIQFGLEDMASQGGHRLSAAARFALDVAKCLEGVKMVSDMDCDWIPFVVEGKAEKKAASIMQHIRRSIRAPKAELLMSKVTAKQKNAFEIGVDNPPNEIAAKMRAATALLKERTSNLCGVTFPDEAICFPVFVSGLFSSDEHGVIIAGVYAVRTDT